MAIDIGRIAYEEYFESLDYEVWPLWEDIGKKQQDAWRAAAVAAAKYINREQEEESKNLAIEIDLLT